MRVLFRNQTLLVAISSLLVGFYVGSAFVTLSLGAFRRCESSSVFYQGSSPARVFVEFIRPGEVPISDVAAVEKAMYTVVIQSFSRVVTQMHASPLFFAEHLMFFIFCLSLEINRASF